MSKTVLFSIKPKYCELIASGKKTIEVRKTKPKLDTPFKCYIYCTKDFYRAGDGYFQGKYCGKVIGEFVCDKIDYFSFSESEWAYSVAPAGSVMPMHETTALKIMEEQGCLSLDEINAYFGDEDYTAYFWHISNLVIYDKPKELSDFRKPCIYGEESDVSCFLCDKSGYRPDMHIDCFNEVTRPPQSWCYVEELI